MSMFAPRKAISIFVVLSVLYPAISSADTGTLTLDSLSFVSFQDDETLPLPSGSTIEFQFGTPNSDGSIPFTLVPSGVSIQPISVPGKNVTLNYGLGSEATGLIRPTSSGRIIEFTGQITATLVGEGADGTYTYGIPFTTETTAAQNALGDIQLEVTGLRLVEGAWYAQLVGATTNETNAFPKPGSAVYTVLSGQFDHLPVAE